MPTEITGRQIQDGSIGDEDFSPSVRTRRDLTPNKAPNFYA